MYIFQRIKIAGTNSGLIPQITSLNQLSVTYIYTYVLVMKITSQNDFFSLHKSKNNEWNTERAKKKRDQGNRRGVRQRRRRRRKKKKKKKKQLQKMGNETKG
ncbi:hypothetical protein CIPAW_09G141000 [Carya illinoinensis]|uniref:Uncharacterized protein n=1 Tax=Carya illinoinensis TaxID=32201 RepID=A0A8T1PCT2_CARIL|nr:hypothetical protein CIPAW_09G141000 [Carya illinoinensis]